MFITFERFARQGQGGRLPGQEGMRGSVPLFLGMGFQQFQLVLKDIYAPIYIHHVRMLIGQCLGHFVALLAQLFNVHLDLSGVSVGFENLVPILLCRR